MNSNRRFFKRHLRKLGDSNARRLTRDADHLEAAFEAVYTDFEAANPESMTFLERFKKWLDFLADEENQAKIKRVVEFLSKLFANA